MAAGSTTGSSLEYTPTWALATVCFFFITTAIIIEHLIHLLTKWLRKHRKTALYDAVSRLQSELMLLGFVSLFLAITQEKISKICIPAKVAEKMLPCRKQASSLTVKVEGYEHLLRGIFGNLTDGLYEYERIRRRLADDEEESAAVSDPCSSKGKVSLVTQKGLNQLSVFIFVLAVMQIVYSFVTMALGRAKMKRWKAWEKETQTTEYQVANDPNRFRFARQTTFGRRHMTACTSTTFHLWVKCFFRQFFHSVAKVDYLTLRHGFISAHLSIKHNNFDFRKYIQRSLEEDFKVVVSISPLMWLLVVVFILFDVYGWHLYLWISYVPLVVVLVLGTKLEVIVARMALQIKDQNSIIKGTPLVQPNDDLFWFGQPKFVLTLLHLTLFMNAFELAFFIWVTIQFGFSSCHHEHTIVTVTRLVLAVTVQVLCSYITLPLYALVTQMGSEFKSKVLEESVAKIIKQWHAEIRERRRKQDSSFQSSRNSLSTDFSTPRASNMTNYESIHYYNRGEITEEQTEIVEVEADSPISPGAVTIELSRFT